MIIKNREEVIKELAEMLLQFDKDLNAYQTDVYAYYDEEQQIVSLDTFVNVGGRSWLDDNHVTIYRDEQHDYSAIDTFQSIGEIADVLEMSAENLIAEASQVEEIDEDDISYYEIKHYVLNKDEYKEKIQTEYERYLEANDYADYVEKAREIIDEYEESVDNPDMCD